MVYNLRYSFININWEVNCWISFHGPKAYIVGRKIGAWISDLFGFEVIETENNP